MENCSQLKCDIEQCRLRHPQVCRYFRDIGYCKFGEWWLFKHDGVIQGSKEIKELTDKLKNIEKIISEKNKDIESLEKIMTESFEKNNVGKFEEFAQAVEIKMEVFETNLSTLKKSLIEKDTYISKLENKIQDFEKVCEVQQENIEQLVKDNENNSKNIEYLYTKIFDSSIKYKSVTSSSSMCLGLLVCTRDEPIGLMIKETVMLIVAVNI